MPSWGLLANEGLEDKPIKAVYFFAGNWKWGSDPIFSDKFYDEMSPRNDKDYTIFPEDFSNLWWSQSPLYRNSALDLIERTGANVIVMSSWGVKGTDNWAFSAPMQTAPGSHDELFDAAVGRSIRIMPAIESCAGTPGGKSPAYQFSDDFPGTANDPAPGLVAQIIELVNRYIKSPANPAWPDLWAKMYDKSGTPRYAINLIHVASGHLDSGADAEFAAGFDAVASLVLQHTSIQVGFTLDVLPTSHTYQIGDDRGWVPWFTPPELANIVVAPGSPITQTWSTKNHLDLYVIDAHGTVCTTWWDQEPIGYRPGGWFPVHRETVFVPGALVTAIRRTDDHVDLFATDKDGIVRSIWWDKKEPLGYRPEGWLEVHPEMRCPPGSGAPVAASWGSSAHLDIFVTDQFGVIQGTYWDRNANGFRADGWFAIAPSTVFKPGGCVTALHQGEKHLDLFAADAQGIVQSIDWNAKGGYRAEGWFAIDPGNPAAPGAQISALWTKDTHLDLFMTGADGLVRSTYWDKSESLGFTPLGWFPITNTSDFKCKAGTPVEALWTHDNTRLHLFITDLTGRMAEAFWTNDNGWSLWDPLWPSPTNVASAAITSSHPRGVHIDAFVTGEAGIPLTTWQDDLHDTYVGHPAKLGPYLLGTASMLGIQGYIPEIWLGGKTDDIRFKHKIDYWFNWRIQGVPVIMDISPGYDAHLVFPGSTYYGYTDEWRENFVSFLSSTFTGVVYNAWNGYTEGYAGMQQQGSGFRDYDWLVRMFGLL